MNKKLILILVIIIGAAAIIYSCFIKNRNLDTLTLYGNVEIRQVDISFQVNGIIKKMFFEEGEPVKEGDLLASLDDKDYRANYKKSRSEIKKQKAILDEAISLLETNTKLCEEKITPWRQCISYTNLRNESQAAYESAIIENRFQKNQLEYTKVYAPSDGIITTRVQEPGATVNSGQIIYTMMKLKPIWIRAYISEVNLGDITYGTKTRVITDTIDKNTGFKKEYIGRIGYISPVAEFTPKTVQTEDLRTDLVYRINVYIDEADEFLKQGMPTTIEINLKNKEIINEPAKLH